MFLIYLSLIKGYLLYNTVPLPATQKSLFEILQDNITLFPLSKMYFHFSFLILLKTCILLFSFLVSLYAEMFPFLK